MSEDDNKYRLLFDENPAMLYSVDQDGIILSVNRFGADALGYKQEELINTSYLQLLDEQDKLPALGKSAIQQA